MKKIIPILFMLMVFNQLPGYSQDTIKQTIISDKNLNEDHPIIQTKLLPLSVFFKNIDTHPSVGIYETYKEEASANLMEERRKWLDYLKFVANYQYGKNYLFNDNTSSTGGNTLFSSNKATNNYGVGVSISIPIGDLSSRNQRVRSKREALKRSQYEYELAIEERKLMILEAYNAVVEQLATLKAKSETVILYNAQMNILEENFKMGKINITQLSQERSRHTDAIISYEEGKVGLHNAITLLEMLSNVKILNN